MCPLNTVNGLVFKIVKQEIAQQRYEICKQCPRLTVLKICSFCNCIMPVKVKFAIADCPAGRWPAVTDTNLYQSEAYEDLK